MSGLGWVTVAVFPGRHVPVITRAFDDRIGISPVASRKLRSWVLMRAARRNVGAWRARTEKKSSDFFGFLLFDPVMSDVTPDS